MSQQKQRPEGFFEGTEMPTAGWITQDEYDRKARELKERQTEIALRIEHHQKGEGDFRTTLEGLISLASRAAELFEPFENGAKAPTHRLRLFEPATQRKKARVFIAFAL